MTDKVSKRSAIRPEAMTKFVKANTRTIVIGLIVLIVAIAYVHQVQTTNNLKRQNQQLTNPQSNSQNQATAIRDEVAKLIIVPTNETPTVATVSDVSKLQNQPFFANAKNGDKVLIFNKAKEAILYRPSDNKIVEVAPLNSSSNSSSSSTGTTGN